MIRRAATTVKMHPGETFAVAGLFQQDYANTVRQIPWASEVPILGALFRSARWRRSETELVILVTPRLATAEESVAAAPRPVADSHEYDPIQLILDRQVLDKPMQKRVGDEPPPIKVSRAGRAP